MTEAQLKKLQDNYKASEENLKTAEKRIKELEGANLKLEKALAENASSDSKGNVVPLSVAEPTQNEDGTPNVHRCIASGKEGDVWFCEETRDFHADSGYDQFIENRAKSMLAAMFSVDKMGGLDAAGHPTYAALPPFRPGNRLQVIVRVIPAKTAQEPGE